MEIIYGRLCDNFRGVIRIDARKLTSRLFALDSLGGRIGGDRPPRRVYARRSGRSTGLPPTIVWGARSNTELLRPF